LLAKVFSQTARSKSRPRFLVRVFFQKARTHEARAALTSWFGFSFKEAGSKSILILARGFDRLSASRTSRLSLFEVAFTKAGKT
jgi:hypothetical protein